MARTSAAAFAVLALSAGGLLVAGCRATPTTTTGSAVSTSATPSSGTAHVPVGVSPPAGGRPVVSPTPSAATTPRCQTSQLRAQLAEPDGAAGNRYQKLTLRNVGAACRMWGWVGLQLEGPSVGLVPTSVVHTGTPVSFTLPAGGTTTTTLHWNVVPTGSESTTDACEPVASELRVYPPGQSTARIPAWTYGPVCGHGRFDVPPMTP
jgi:Protein of unknown function (DUF4232)